MFRNKLSTLCLRNFSTSSLAYARQLCSQPLLPEQPMAEGITNLRDSLAEKIKAVQQQQNSLWHSGRNVSIYRVPAKLRNIEPRAYEPRVISIGPYHHGSPNVQASEVLKLDSLNHVVGSGAHASDELDRLLSALETIEPKARDCYSEADLGLSRDAFIEMMLLDGCFIVEFFKDLNKTNFTSSSLLPKRWMLPVVRRDLIALENQLPMIVLKKIFEQTTIKSNSIIDSSIEGLALKFFDPLMPREVALLHQSIVSSTNSSQNFHHLLDVFHSSITLGARATRGKEPHMYQPLTELKKAGIKVRLLSHTQPLEMRFERGVLRIPGLLIDSHIGSFLKNIVAYEQCHHECKPDVTTNLYFLDKLINSGEDVGLLHYEGVIQHSLGSNKQVSKLISALCIDVEHDGHESYLYELVDNLNSYSGKWWTKVKSRLKQDYFGNMWVSISTLAALLLLYLTLLQASSDALKSQKKRIYLELEGLWAFLHLCLLDPVEAFKYVKASVKDYFASFLKPKDDDDASDGPSEFIN